MSENQNIETDFILKKEEKANVSILIVEDSITQGKKLEFTLKNNGFNVKWVKNGILALEELKKEKPYIVISDILMPEMDGYELCKFIKQNENYSDIPVILLTSLTGPHDILKGLEAGADNFYTKPYDEEDLLHRIDYVIANKKLREVSPKPKTDMGIEIYFGGQKHLVTSGKMQIIDLLFSTYEMVLKKNEELKKVNKELKEALSDIKTLSGLIPICANCKSIRNDDGFWQQIESYIDEHSDAKFSHGICPKCMEELYPEYTKKHKK